MYDDVDEASRTLRSMKTQTSAPMLGSLGHLDRVWVDYMPINCSTLERGEALCEHGGRSCKL